MRPPLAWLNTSHRGRRSAVATSGIAFAVLLLFMQAGFLEGARTNLRRPLAWFDADLVILNRGYLSMGSSGLIGRARIRRAAAIPGVERTAAVLVDGARWRNLAGGGAGVLVFGADPENPPFRDGRINALLPRLRGSATALADREGRPSLGAWEVGDRIQLNRQPITLVGDYALGLGLLADGSVIVSEDTFERIFSAGAKERPNFGLVRVAAGASVAEVAARLRDALPRDVRVETLEEMSRNEENYFLTVKPVGIIFEIGMAVAFLAGAAMLYQTLAADLMDRRPEYALLKALGHSTVSIYLVGAQQAVIFALLAFGPAVALAGGFGIAVRRLSGFPIALTLARTGALFGLTLLMAAVAAGFALAKIRRADPASLYSR